MTEWIDPYVGFKFSPQTATVTTQMQQERLGACGLDPAQYGSYADPSFFITLGIHAGIHSGITAEGNINMLQSLVQHRPARLNEALQVHGTITDVTDVPRGQTVYTDVWFEDEHGARVISAPRRSLRPDPAKAAARGAGVRPGPVITDPQALAPETQHALTPERVRAYSTEGNAIHYEMDAAQRAGFRAPMIGGAMGVHFLLAAIWPSTSNAEPLSTLDLDIFFRRPIFWDDEFSVGREPSSGGICLWNVQSETNKVLTEARINQMA
jgi:hydroxyacyl-ACP dehydratase HTD2-like protein with hotdog domain